MIAMLPLIFLFLLLLAESLQVHGASIPILRPHPDNIQWPSNMCTSNITIPTPTERCTSSCSPMQRAQTICRDKTLCMCSIARSPEACFDCILEDIGTFALSIPHYVESLQHQISVYAASCALQGQLLGNQSTELDPRESEAARRMVTLCSMETSRQSQLLTVFTNTPSFRSDFYSLFPIFSFVLAIVLLLIVRLHK